MYFFWWGCSTLWDNLSVAVNKWWPLNVASCCSLQPGLGDSWGILDAIRKVKVGESGVKSLEISSSVPVSQSTEIGYLNVTSPVSPNCRLEQEESLSATSDEAWVSYEDSEMPLQGLPIWKVTGSVKTKVNSKWVKHRQIGTVKVCHVWSSVNVLQVMYFNWL